MMDCTRYIKEKSLFWSGQAIDWLEYSAGGKLILNLFFDSRNGFILPWVPERYFLAKLRLWATKPRSRSFPNVISNCVGAVNKKTFVSLFRHFRPCLIRLTFLFKFRSDQSSQVSQFCRETRFLGQSHGLTMRHKNITVNKFTSRWNTLSLNIFNFAL